MNGELVGKWCRSHHGQHEFAYAESWLSSPGRPPISLMFPLRPSNDPYRGGVEDFFDNLLADSRNIRQRIQKRFRTPSANAFDLLTEVGRDCVGALQILTDGETPGNAHSFSSERLTERDVANILTATSLSTVGTDQRAFDCFRVSLPGAQEKTALLKRDGVWQRPIGATPTTHILKLPMGINAQRIDLSTSIENEWLCAQIIRAFNIAVANCSIAIFGEQKALVVERFDRRLSADGRCLTRLPQEDFCQATGTPAVRKYESDGGPGIDEIMKLLNGSKNPENDRYDFMKTQLVFWLLAAIDGHAKNFSIFLVPDNGYTLTPRYDILSAYPVLGHGAALLSPHKIRMAMAVTGKNRHYRWKEITARHWMETAKRCDFSQ
jgi:serine/threonine-protein kinase HipA